MGERNYYMENIKELSELKISIFDLRKIYDKLEEDKIKNELKCIIIVLDKIYKEVLVNSNKLSKIKNLSSYYIVTIKKILDKYCYFKQMNVTSKESEDLYKKIETFLPEVSKSFEKIYQSLFNDEITDIDAEIKVMLKQMKI